MTLLFEVSVDQHDASKWWSKYEIVQSGFDGFHLLNLFVIVVGG